MQSFVVMLFFELLGHAPTTLNHTPNPTGPAFNGKRMRACSRTVTWLTGAARGFAGRSGKRVKLLGSLFMTNKPFAFY